MATVNFVKARGQTGGGMLGCMQYCARPEKTMHEGIQLVTGVNCVAQTAFREFMNTKRLYNKPNGRMYYHIVQSFHPEEKVTPKTAHEIALKLAQAFPGHEVLVSTHVDRAHIHSHLIVNSVNAETSYKYHSDKDNIQRVRNVSDKLCNEYGLSILQPKQKRSGGLSSREYQAAEKGQGWKIRLAVAIDETMKLAGNREQFIWLMELEGYGVRWNEDRKYITYTTPEGNKCRDIKLYHEKYRKENIEYEFTIRKEITGAVGRYRQDADAGSRADRDLHRIHGSQSESTDRCTEYSVQADRSDKSENGYGDAGSGVTGISESAGGSFANQAERVRQCCGMVYRGDSQDSEENGSNLRETGWERERTYFQSSRNPTEEDGYVYEETALDRDHSHWDTLDVGMGAAYLAADLSGIIEEDNYVEDCTTKPFCPERKNTRGHAMGSM